MSFSNVSLGSSNISYNSAQPLKNEKVLRAFTFASAKTCYEMVLKEVIQNDFSSKRILEVYMHSNGYSPLTNELKLRFTIQNKK